VARPSFWTALGTVTLVVGGALYYFVAERPPALAPAMSSAAATPPARKPVTVEARAVAVSTVTDDLLAIGSLEPNESVVVSPEIAGRIARIGFAEGDPVAAGDVLAELDDTILRAELSKARSDLTLAQANHQRAMRWQAAARARCASATRRSPSSRSSRRTSRSPRRGWTRP